MNEIPPPPPSRERRLERLDDGPLDVLVVGGGVTGCGVALDLAARGLRTAVVERGDWASATSSASSRLIHGGLRYLEHFELGLVRESCLERGLLLRNAAGLVWPESFTFPIRDGDPVGRAKLMAGLWLYTLVSTPRILGLPRRLSKAEALRRIPGMAPGSLRGGGAYLDGATDDARLTLAIVLTAMCRGAIALSRTEVTALERSRAGISAELRDTLDGATRNVEARAAVLAGGPFTDRLRARAGLGGGWVQPTRGTHLLVPRDRLPTDGAVIFPSPVDGRILFLLARPRETIIGTTDLDASPEDAVRGTAAEVDYLLDSANGLVPDAGLVGDDVISTFSGLRPLLAARGKDPSARSREERVEHEDNVWTIAGGKLTAWRSMAEGLGARITDVLMTGRGGHRSPTRRLLLHGALPDRMARPAWSSLPASSAPDLERARDEVWMRRYAALAPAVRELVDRTEGGTEPLDPDTLLGEVDWAVEREDCLCAEDFLFRRTDLALAGRETAERLAGAVLDRMASGASWDAPRRARERERALAALARVHGWREEPR